MFLVSICQMIQVRVWFGYWAVDQKNDKSHI